MTAEFHRMTDTNFKAAVQLILQASMDGKPKHEAVLSLGATPQFLLDNGFPELPLSIKGAVIDKAHFDHGITRGVLERLAEIITTPKALYKSATVQGTAVVITFEMKAGSPILVPIHGNKPVGRSFMLVALDLDFQQLGYPWRPQAGRHGQIGADERQGV